VADSFVHWCGSPGMLRRVGDTGAMVGCGLAELWENGLINLPATHPTTVSGTLVLKSTGSKVDKRSYLDGMYI